MAINYPFAAIAGQEDMKQALLLVAIEPRLSGVLILGEKGTAKSTAVRSLAELLPGKTRVVNLPVSATEDRVVGTMDFEKAVKTGEKHFEPGLLKEADGNILYVDEVNLLEDHIVDVLLDAAAMGVNRVEREGISFEHPSRFVLVGTMNPEEGDLRPQLLDRFGLCVRVTGEPDPEVRQEIVERRLGFEKDPEKFRQEWEPEQEKIRQKISAAREILPTVQLPEDIIELAVKIALGVGVEGHRADIMLCKTAMVIAAFDGRNTVTKEDLLQASAFVLPHRMKRQPFEERAFDIQQVKEILDERESSKQETPQKTEQAQEQNHRPFDWKSAAGVDGRDRNSRAAAGSGAYVGSRIPGEDKVPASEIALDTTARAAAAHAENGILKIAPEDWRVKIREQSGSSTILFAVDASGSVGAHRRMKAVKTLILSLLKDSYKNRDRVGMVAFRKDSAEVLLPFTNSVERARQELNDLPTGGRTPLAEGLELARTMLEREKKQNPDSGLLLVVVTDGRANSGENAMDRAKKAAIRVRNAGIPSIVIDSEQGHRKLRFAKQLAGDLGAKYDTLDSVLSEK